MKNPAKIASSFPLRGVGPQIAKHLARLNIFSVPDLLLHLPLRYQDRTQIQPIRSLIPDEHAVIEGEIKSITQPLRGRTKLLCELKDATGTLYLRFFHLLSFQKNSFKVGMRLRCYSEVRMGPKGLEMFHPEFKIISPEKNIPIEQHLTAIYAATEGLSQHMLRKLIGNALDELKQNKHFTELLPPTILQSLQFPTLKEALYFVHQPSRDVSSQLMETKTVAQTRLIFEELLAHRISLLQIKKYFQTQTSPVLSQYEKLSQQFLHQLPFSLTQAQTRVVQEIQQDLLKPHPMLRLVQGDVGSGKTVVAAFAMLQAVESGYQTALMAPTELLAEQHYRVFKKWLEPLKINVVFLSGSVKSSARRQVLQAIENGSAQIILGTHALFQAQIKFARLAFIIVDEQHRFGVHQRALLLEKGVHAHYPHQLIMTATPIPRTLSMSFYADLDCSIIDELPPGRTPIMTSVIANYKREEVIARVRDACEAGRQAYWVCSLIDESEMINAQSAVEITQQLQQCLPTLKIGLIHGRLSADQKELIMQAFQRGEIHLLVATTVIEVGVDVPNASLMIIENAERMGLAQLHQLRGRVGRGKVASHCVLLYQHPLSDIAKERLHVMRSTTDGFQIAQRDLELRGPGEVFGVRQTGELAFKVADLSRDKNLWESVDQTANIIMQAHPEVIEPLTKRWLGEGKEYAKL